MEFPISPIPKQGPPIVFHASGNSSTNSPTAQANSLGLVSSLSLTPHIESIKNHMC